jgi:serine protease Do
MEVIIMEENSKNQKTYQVIDMSEDKTKKSKSNNTFSKNVLLPFCSGVVGAALVVGTCFGVPQVRNTIFQNTDTAIQTSSTSETNSTNVTSSLSQVSLTNYSETGTYAAKKVLPSIVGITVEYTASSVFLRNTSTATASGSGIIISEDGYILTNNHIVNSSSSSSSSSSYYEVGEASKVTVYLYNDETEYEATIIGTDSQTDLAVIKIDKTGLTPAELGDSDSVSVGEFAMAVGNPLGMDSSVTAGIISAVNRKVTDSDGKTWTLIQTDAAINSGNSGGALVNSEGQVIGINTLKLSGTGIEGMGFAIPINSTKTIYEQLIQYNKVKRPYIGVTGLDLDEKTAEYNNLVVGIYVKDIETFSAAEKGGLKIGDVIIGADGKSITTMNELNEIKNAHNIGDQMTLKVNRNGNEIDITLTLQEQP